RRFAPRSGFCPHADAEAEATVEKSARSRRRIVTLRAPKPGIVDREGGGKVTPPMLGGVALGAWKTWASFGPFSDGRSGGLPEASRRRLPLRRSSGLVG